MRFEFVARGGGEVGRTVALSTGESLTFGRLKTCDVQLDDEAVSRRHCTLHAREDRCFVADEQSANGTFVNDNRVSTAELKPYDKLRIGSTVFEFVLSEGPVARSSQASVDTTSFRVTPEEHGHTLIRKSVDPNKLAFLTEVFRKKDESAVLESAQRYLSTLHHVSDLLSRASGVEALFDSILSTILEVTGGERAAILLAEQAGALDSSTAINAAAFRTKGGPPHAGEMVLSRTVVRDVLEKGMSTFSHDAQADSRYGAGDSIVRQHIRSVMCAPMRTTDRVLGVLYVDSPSTHTFSESELELLAAIGNQAGVALHRARLLAEVERLFIDVMRAIAAIIDAKDGYTHRHSERVAQFSVRLARELGLTTDNRAIVELAALLHDLGKIGVPDAILNKPGKLTDEEFEEMKQHPVHGAAILANIQSERVKQLLPGVKYHHERWDGTGYPEGLRGEDIPLLGRILAVADFLDALSSDRTYRAATPVEDVIEIVRKMSGSAFDPTIVEALLTLHARGELALPVSPSPALR
jgi:HD-GYP domain-containing protein (c-di-GMP phosphodiesterase class II)